MMLLMKDRRALKNQLDWLRARMDLMKQNPDDYPEDEVQYVQEDINDICSILQDGRIENCYAAKDYFGKWALYQKLIQEVTV